MPRITVSAGNHDRLFVPVTATVPAVGAGPLQLVDQESQRAVPFQVGGDGSQITWIVENLAAGQSRDYVLSPGAGTPAPGVSLQTVGEDRVEVRIGEELFTAYYFGREYARPFLYPVIGPFGASVTRHFPMKNVEWREPGPQASPLANRLWRRQRRRRLVGEPGHGRIVHAGFRGLEEGPVYAAIRSRSDWVSNAGEKVLSETRDVVIYALPSALRVIDYEVSLNATEGEVKFGDTKEGGILSVRVTSSMDAARGGRIENSYGGINEAETWGKRAAWCDYSGPVEGKWVAHRRLRPPGNLRYHLLARARLRPDDRQHVRPLGVLQRPQSAAATARAAGRPGLRFRYRIYVHPGDARQGAVAAKYHDFINPQPSPWQPNAPHHAQPFGVGNPPTPGHPFRRRRGFRPSSYLSASETAVGAPARAPPCAAIECGHPGKTTRIGVRGGADGCEGVGRAADSESR